MKKKSVVIVVAVIIIAIIGGIALLPLARLFSNEKLSLNDIQTMVSAGSIDVVYQSNGNVRLIDGTFTDVVVNTREDAAKALQLSSLLLGETFSVTTENITHQTAEVSNVSAEHFYRYSPIVNGIPVVGSQVILTTNEEGQVTGLFSTYNDNIYSVNTEPDISEKEALGKAWEALLSNEEINKFLNQYVSDDLPKSAVIAEFKDRMATNVKLQIYAAADENKPLLIYAVSVCNKAGSSAIIDNDGDHTYNGFPINIESAHDPETVNTDFVMIDMTYYFLANGDSAGELHHVVNNVQGWDTVYLTAEDENGETRVFSAQTQNGTYRLRDAERNIETYKTTYGNILWIEPKLPGKLVEFTSSVSRVAVSTHANMTVVYDYYLEVLGRKSFDGNGKKIIASYDYDNCQFIFTGNYRNASWRSSAQQFVFGDEGNFASALDVVAHEFTHAVINYIVGDGYDISLTYYGESGALNEAYADIMGCLIEGKDDEGLWLCGEDSDEVIRSMKDPSAYNQPEHYDDRYVGENDHGGVHTNSGIFNYAAYKMITDKRTHSIQLTTWAKVFYRSLHRLTSDATFADARGAIISAAKNIGFSAEQINAIKDAFDAVGIKSGTPEDTTPGANPSTPTATSKPSHGNPTDPTPPPALTSELNIGDHIYFGSANSGQDADTWQVINVDGDYALIYNMCVTTGVFDATMHAETKTINLMRYHTYGSVTWEYSDVRSWLNSRDESVAYQDILFDYGVAGIATVPWPSDKIPTYAHSSGFLTRFSEYEYHIIQPVTHQNLIPWTESGKDSVFDTAFENFNIDLSQFYQEPYGVTETTDLMFLLNGWEFKEYVLDNGMWGYYYPNGRAMVDFWLRDSANTDFAGFYGYYGTHALTAGSGKAGSNQADLTSAIRPACYIDIRYIAEVAGTGSFEDPYRLTIDPSVVNREIEEFCVSVSPSTEGIVSERLEISVHDGYCSVDGIGTCSDTDVVIPGTYEGLPVTTIGEAAFFDCSWIKSITLSENLVTIGESAFGSCTSLVAVNVAENNPELCSIGGVLYNKDKSVILCYPAGKTDTSFVIPSSVASIGVSAFRDCSHLVQITIPDSVTTIGEFAFLWCTNLDNITIPNSVTRINDGAFQSCTSLTNIVIPDSVTDMGDVVFYNCENLTSVSISASLTRIPEISFAYCTSLQSITIPVGIVEIGISAFAECYNLTDIRFEGTIEQWNAIIKPTGQYPWNKNIPATDVTCSDGTVGLYD